MTVCSPRYLVVRETGTSRDGKWYVIGSQSADFEPKTKPTIGEEQLVLTSTGCVEHREDGTTAEVWVPLQPVDNDA